MNEQEKKLYIDNKILGQRMKETRKSKGVTQEMLAERMNKSIGI